MEDFTCYDYAHSVVISFPDLLLMAFLVALIVAESLIAAQ